MGSYCLHASVSSGRFDPQSGRLTFRETIFEPVDLETLRAEGGDSLEGDDAIGRGNRR